jgi:amino acid permease
VLGLPASLSWLGWAAGLFALVLFFAISLWCALMLTEVYKVSWRAAYAANI